MAMNQCKARVPDDGEKPPYRPAPTELQILKMKLRAISRIATAATVLEKFQDIPRLRDITSALTNDVKAGCADLADLATVI